MAAEPAADDGDWLGRDAESSAWRREVQHLKRRARARLPVVIALTLVTTALATAYVMQRAPLHTSQMIIRVTEGHIVHERSPLASRDLRGYVVDSALTTRNLLAIIERFELYPVARLRGERAAIAELLDSLEIEVFRNYFLGDALGQTTERSARVSISFRDRDPQRSFAVARAIADLIVETETARRAGYSSEDLQIALAAAQQASAALDAREGALAQVKLDLARAIASDDAAARAALTVERDTLLGQIEAQQLRLTKASHLADAQRLMSTVDRAQLGLRWAVVDERAPPPSAGGLQKLVMTALAALLILFPLCGVAVGAFDSRLRDHEDITRLGLRVVGHVPRFAGQRVGGLDERRRRLRRWRGDVKLRHKL